MTSKSKGLPAGIAALVATILLPACGTHAPRMAANPAAPANPLASRPADLQFNGKVIRVNAEERYVVIECAVLPNIGEEAKVVRNERDVGRVRFSGPFSFPYAVADVVGGQPMTGDRVRQ